MRVPYVIRLGREEDLPAILALQRQTEETPQWKPAAYGEYLGAAVPGRSSRKALFVAAAGEWLTGFAAISLVLDQAELENITVRREARRSRVGSRLLGAAWSWLHARGGQSLLLEVRAANQQAQAFYRARGFRREGLRRGYYNHPVDDAVLMRLEGLACEGASPSIL